MVILQRGNASTKLTNLVFEEQGEGSSIWVVYQALLIYYDELIDCLSLYFGHGWKIQQILFNTQSVPSQLLPGRPLDVVDFYVHSSRVLDQNCAE